MAHLTLAGVSDDGKHLRLVEEDGTEHSVAIDARLRAALGAEPSRRLETTMDKASALRPRDIQARIRAGETPEAVAQAAQSSVDKIMPFAAPVLAERQHVAERAQRSSVRRSEGSAPHGARTLGEAVATHLRAINVDPDGVEWDAWRREDGRWSMTARFTAAARTGTAELTFDTPGNYVTLDNEDARWLVGESVAPAPIQRDDLRQVRERRLSAVHDDELPLGDDGRGEELGDDAIDLVSDQPLEAFLDEQPPTEPDVAEQDAALREEAEAAAADEPDQADEAQDAQKSHEPDEHEAPTRRPVKKTRGRASVPSWDEIMFGGGGPE